MASDVTCSRQMYHGGGGGGHVFGVFGSGDCVASGLGPAARSPTWRVLLVRFGLHDNKMFFFETQVVTPQRSEQLAVGLSSAANSDRGASACQKNQPALHSPSMSVPSRAHRARFEGKKFESM